MAQLICRYRKGEEARWISHLDVKRTLERAMRRAQLPLALTQGHNPHPKLSLGPPLPVGVTGEAELLAVHLDTALSPDVVKERLNSQLPRGLQVMEAWLLPGYRKKETFGDIELAEYRVTVRGGSGPEQVRSRIAELLASRELVVQRGGDRPERSVDLRPLTLSLDVAAGDGDEIELRMRLRTGSHGGARPQEIVQLLGLESGDIQTSYHRVGLYASGQAADQPRARARPRWGQTGRRGQRR